MYNQASLHPGAGTLTINNATTTPSVSINFPSTIGFTWTTSFQATTDFGPDYANPLTGVQSRTGPSQVPQFAFAPAACTANSLTIYATSVGYNPTSNVVIVTVQNNQQVPMPVPAATSMSCAVVLAPPLVNQEATASCTSAALFTVATGDQIQYSIIQTGPPTPGVGYPGQEFPSPGYTRIGATLTCQQ